MTGKAHSNSLPGNMTMTMIIIMIMIMTVVVDCDDCGTL